MKKPVKVLCWIFLLGGILDFFMLLSLKDSRAYIMLVVAIICLVLLIFDKTKKNKLKKEQQEHYDAQIKLNYIDGIPNITKNSTCALTIKDDILHITQGLNQFEAASLGLNQITNIGAFTESEIIEKSKHVIGRSVAGGMVFGPVGAIVGGISGTQKKQKKQVRIFLVINYISAQDQTTSALTFENVNPFGGTQKFIDYVNAHIVKKTVSL